MTINFSKVTERHKKIVVVGTGASLKGEELKFEDDVAVIAVNGAINHLERIDYWFTLNPSSANNAIMQTRNRKPGIKYYAAVPDDHRPISEHVHFLHRLTGTGHGRFKTRCGMPYDKGAISTGNSGYGAFQLGVHMEPAYMALFGIDAHGEYHYGGSPRVLNMIPELFESLVPDLEALNINVVNGSPISLITSFPRLTPQGAVNWINSRKV